MAQVELSTLAISLSPRNILEFIMVFSLVAVALYLRTSNSGTGPWVRATRFRRTAAYRLLPAMQQTFTAVVRIRANRSALDNIEGDLLASTPAPSSAGSADPGWQGRPRSEIRLHEVRSVIRPTGRRRFPISRWSFQPDPASA